MGGNAPGLTLPRKGAQCHYLLLFALLGLYLELEPCGTTYLQTWPQTDSPWLEGTVKVGFGVRSRAMLVRDSILLRCKADLSWERGSSWKAIWARTSPAHPCLVLLPQPICAQASLWASSFSEEVIGKEKISPIVCFLPRELKEHPPHTHSILYAFHLPFENISYDNLLWGGLLLLGFFLEASRAQSPFNCIPWALLHEALMACFPRGAYFQLCMVRTAEQQEEERSRRWDSTLAEHSSPYLVLGWEGGGELSAPR